MFAVGDMYIFKFIGTHRWKHLLDTCGSQKWYASQEAGLIIQRTTVSQSKKQLPLVYTPGSNLFYPFFGQL